MILSEKSATFRDHALTIARQPAVLERSFGGIPIISPASVSGGERRDRARRHAAGGAAGAAAGARRLYAAGRRGGGRRDARRGGRPRGARGDRASPSSRSGSRASARRWSRDAEDRVERHFVILCFAARWTGGEPVLNEELSEARWLRPDELAALPTTPGSPRSWRRRSTACGRRAKAAARRLDAPFFRPFEPRYCVPVAIGRTSI